MAFIEKAKEFEKELNELRVQELCKDDCQEELLNLRSKIDDFLNMLKPAKRKMQLQFEN